MNLAKLVLLSVLALPVVAAPADWAQFRGPNGSGVSPDAKPPTTWSETQNLKWKMPLPGAGTSSPILVAEKIFVTCWTDGTGGNATGLRRQLVCLNRETGMILWSKSVDGEAQVDRYDGYMQEHGYASHTPALAGRQLFLRSNRNLYCIDAMQTAGAGKSQ